MLKALTSRRVPVLIAVLYLICFQVFLLFPQYLWLCIGNIILFSVVTGYAFFTARFKQRRVSFPGMISMGLRVTCTASLVALAGAVALSVLNFYFLPGLKNASFFSGNASTPTSFSGWRELVTLLLTNTLLVNLVCGGLASFFTAGLINERDYSNSKGPLSSVDLYRSKKMTRIKNTGDSEENSEVAINWNHSKLALQADAAN